MVYALYAIRWTEYERGWGPRPDGVTYYTTKQKAEESYNKAFEGRQGSVPDDYSNPSDPFLVEVSKALYDSVHSNGYIRLVNPYTTYYNKRENKNRPY